LDILRAFSRALRRANIPVVFSQGFNPHPSISFGLPLSVGVTSECEYVDIDIEDSMSLEGFLESINKGLSAGLKVIDAEETDLKSNIMASITSAKYRVNIYGHDINILKDKLNDVLTQDTIMVEKETKKGINEVDIKPAIRDIKIKKADENSAELFMNLDAGSNSNLKPEMVVKALEKYIGIVFEDVDVHRLELVF
jgi:radical SAM-linked protein